MTAPTTWKRMKLRYAGACRDCGTGLDQGVPAVYDRAARNVICLPCADKVQVSESTGAVVPELDGPSQQPTEPVRPTSRAPVPPPGPAAPARTAPPAPVEPPPPPPPTSVEIGTAGASARREFERRAAKREQRVRERHPGLGGLILALSDDPQSTTAWRTGARGEEVLGKRLDDLAASGVRALHDRRIPRSRANIDHIAISSAGVFVLDAKRYKGRPTLRVEGGILRPRLETLMVGGRKCNPLVEGMHKQLGLVQAVVGHDVPITGMLVFIDADWPLIGGDFVTRHVRVLWAKKAAEHILKPGPLAAHEVEATHRLLARAFPPA